MARDDIRVTSQSKLYARPADFADVRRVFRRGYTGHPIPVARKTKTLSRYIPITEIDIETRGYYLDVNDPWSLLLHKRIVESLMEEGVEVRYVPSRYTQDVAEPVPYIWVRLMFTANEDDALTSFVGAGCGPDPLSALLRAVGGLPERSKLTKDGDTECPGLRN